MRHSRALGFVFTDFVEEELLDWIRNLLEGGSGDAEVATSDSAHATQSRKQL